MDYVSRRIGRIIAYFARPFIRPVECYGSSIRSSRRTLALQASDSGGNLRPEGRRVRLMTVGSVYGRELLRPGGPGPKGRIPDQYGSSRRAGFVELRRQPGRDSLNQHGSPEEDSEFARTDVPCRDVAGISPTTDGARRRRRRRHARRRTRGRARPGRSRCDRVLHGAECSRQSLAIRATRDDRRDRGDHRGGGRHGRRSPGRSHRRIRGRVPLRADRSRARSNWMSWSTASPARSR